MDLVLLAPRSDWLAHKYVMQSIYDKSTDDDDDD